MNTTLNMNKFSKFPAEVICELHPLFKGLLWVASARSSDETRPVLNTVNVERDGLDCHLVATDGRRMHVHTFEPGLFDDDIDMIASGLYDVVIKSAKLIVIAPSECGDEYPNWRGLIPDYKPENCDLLCSRSIGKIGVVTGVLLATDFVTAAIGYNTCWKKDEAVSVSYGSPEQTGPFLISHQFGKAIVMPMRLGEEEEPAEDDEEEPKTEAEATPDFPELSDAFLGLMKVMASDGDSGATMTVSVGDNPVATVTTAQAKQIVKKRAGKKAAKKAARKR